MADGKVIKSGGGSFGAKGGSGHMFGKQHAGAQKPGTTAHDVSGDAKWAEGGKGHMFGKQDADTKKPGQSGK